MDAPCFGRAVAALLRGELHHNAYLENYLNSAPKPDKAPAPSLQQRYLSLNPGPRKVLEAVLQDPALNTGPLAGRLHLSVNTVKTHLRAIFSLLGVASRHELTLLAVREGWIRPPSESTAVRSDKAATRSLRKPTKPRRHRPARHGADPPHQGMATARDGAAA